MEKIHGVDVSWLHRPSHAKIPDKRFRSMSSPAPSPAPLNTNAIPDINKPMPPSPITITTTAPSPSSSSPLDAHHALSTTSGAPPIETPGDRTAPRRPSLLTRNSADSKAGSPDPKPSRKGSWMSTISSKFSSQSPTPTSPDPSSRSPSAFDLRPTSPLFHHLRENRSPSPLQSPSEDVEPSHPYVPQKPKESSSSFFSSLTRRLSSNSQSSNGSKHLPNGGICKRIVLNVDPHRQRCKVHELKDTTLRRVAFSVDVEIASAPRYNDESPLSDRDSPADEEEKEKLIESLERAEGEALKHPDAVAETAARVTLNTDSDGGLLCGDPPKPQLPSDSIPRANSVLSKKEKKKKSEEERKERKDRKRKKAEDSGVIPVEFILDDATPGVVITPRARALSNANKIRPTTDPVRIYRRCCQLRESPILKRITEQLMSPTCVVPGSQGTVAVLDLTGSRMQLPDVVTLADWLAIVPVKRLVLEDSDLTDQGIRVLLAGLLAAQSPQHSKCIKNSDLTPKLGLIERLSLKNNPRITTGGWSHVSLFLYMCRSIKTIDLSMLSFPATKVESSISQTSDLYAEDKHGPTEIFCKALSERLAGSSLEEIILSGCELDAYQVRRVVDAAMTSGVGRLGLAGVELDDESFDKIMSFIRSDICTAIDLGSNDLHGRVDRLVDAISHNSGCKLWGLSLASCNLDTEDLEALCTALETLPNFRFIDLSHNRKLCEDGERPVGGIHVLRQYLPRLRNLKRLHLVDVGLNTQQAIALAEILPECESIAHVSLLENAELSAFVARTDEPSQGEACALFSSLLAAVKASTSIVCVDIDVPPPETCEVVKSLAKQVVAYCLRNMGNLPLTEEQSGSAACAMARPHTDSNGDGSALQMPEVLQHLLSPNGSDVQSSGAQLSPDQEYIVGGTGLCKALQYCLGEKQRDMSADGSSPAVDLLSPSHPDIAKKGSKMSAGLLDSAREMQMRLQTAIAQVAEGGNEAAYCRLVFLDQTLARIISRFEDEYPETQTGASVTVSTKPMLGSSSPSDARGLMLSVASPLDDNDDQNIAVRLSRHNSDVSLASKALSQEEGRFHRIGQSIRHDIMSASPTPHPSTPDSDGKQGHGEGMGGVADPSVDDLRKRLEDVSGAEWKALINDLSWEGALQHLGANIDDLRRMHESDPVAWEQFVESHTKARMNIAT